jgi:Domain of unknown function (DUF4124)
MSRRHVWVAVIFALVWLISSARSADAQKMYKWTDQDGKVHFSNVAPQGDEPQQSAGVSGTEAQGAVGASAAAPTGEAASSNNEEPNEVAENLPDSGTSSVSDEAFSSGVSATRSRLRRELAQAKDEAREASEQLAEAKRLNQESQQPGLAMLQRAMDPQVKAESDEDAIRSRKAKADAKIADIRAQYDALRAEATKRNGGTQPSWWLPIE